jgi:hypothetical protein
MIVDFQGRFVAPPFVVLDRRAELAHFSDPRPVEVEENGCWNHKDAEESQQRCCPLYNATVSTCLIVNKQSRRIIFAILRGSLCS